MGPRKTTLSLFKDVIIRLGRAGVKGKSDDVTLYDVYFILKASPIVNYNRNFMSMINF